MPRSIVFPAIVLALGLAMDATAGAAVRGLVAPRVRARDALLVAILCGGFQGGMAALGWLAGARLGHAVEAVDHWIAFGLLFGLGTRTVVAGLRGGDDRAIAAERAFAPGPLVVLALATSIDAAVAGVTLPLLSVPGWFACALIAGVTFALALGGVYAGRAAGARLGARLDIVGGLALIAIGVEILVDHLTS